MTHEDHALHDAHDELTGYNPELPKLHEGEELCLQVMEDNYEPTRERNEHSEARVTISIKWGAKLKP